MAKRVPRRAHDKAPRTSPGAATRRHLHAAAGAGGEPGTGWGLLAAGLAVTVYLGALDNPFAYDDVATVVNNPSLREPLDWAFVFAHGRLQPVVNLSYALDATWWGMAPHGFHVTSLALHALAVMLFFFWVRALALDAAARREDASRADGPGSLEPAGPASPAASTPPPRRIAFAAAVLLAVHPLMTQAVGYVSARAEVLCAVFSFAALLAARRALLGDGRWWWAGAAVAWALALGSRESAAVLPLVLLAYDRLLRPGSAAARRRRLWLLHLPLLAAAASGAVFRVSTFLRGEAGALPRDIWSQILTELPIYWRYLRLLLWPAGQSLVHPAPRIESLLEPRALVAATGMFVVAAAAWRVRRRQPLVALGALWFPAFLAPAGLVPLVEPMAEHRAYLASCGVFVIVGLALDRAAAWWRAGDRQPGRLPQHLAVAVVAVLALLTMARNRVWADPVTLWADAAAKAPLTWAPHYALGDALRDQRGCAAAIAPYRRAVELRPADNRARINLGVCLAQTRAYDEARRVFAEALTVDPGSADAHTNLGWLANLARRPDLAAAHFRAALERDPDSPVALVNLATLEETVFRNPSEALRLCRVLERAHPGSAAARECIARNERPRTAAP